MSKEVGNMQFYGQVRVNNLVLTTDQCNKMVKCVEKLPSFSEVGDGAVCQLTQPEEGYINGHIYKCVKSGSTGTWEDITSLEKIQELTVDSGSNYVAKKASFTDGGGKSQYRLYWRSIDPQNPTDKPSWPGSISNIDQFVRSEVRAKIGAAPENLDDGILVVGSSKANNGFMKGSAASWYSTTLPRGVSEYTFRVFHVYASGLVLYQDFSS